MDVALTGVREFLIAQGLSGVVILGLAFAVYRLFTLVSQIQEARIKDAREVTEAVINNTAALHALKELVTNRRGSP